MGKEIIIRVRIDEADSFVLNNLEKKIRNDEVPDT